MSRRLILVSIILMGIFSALFFLLVFQTNLPIYYREKVALVKIEGLITSSEPILRKLKKYEKDPTVKAIVIRVDSPGGRVAPTQEIYSTLQKIKEKKKIVASMGSIATSGGYYVALACDRVVANPGTITGSIGVRIDVPIIEELFKKLGIKYEIIKSGDYKDIGSPFRPLRAEERALFKELVDDVYKQFLLAVKEARGISEESLAKIADGRIFSGQQAKRFGLVDTLGTLSTAIEIAAKLSGIKRKPVVIEEKRIFDFFRNSFNILLAKLFEPQFSFLP